MKLNRDFTYKNIHFHLNDNYDIHNKPPRAEFEGRYILMMWHEGYERWQRLINVSTKAEAEEYVRKNFLYI